MRRSLCTKLGIYWRANVALLILILWKPRQSLQWLLRQPDELTKQEMCLVT